MTELKTSSTWNADMSALVSKEDTDEYKRLIRANGIYTRSELDKFNTFYRFHRIDPYGMLGTTTEYVFFTKPDLHIFKNDIYTLNDELKDMPYFLDLHNRGYNETTLRELQYSVDSSTPFVRVLSNKKISNLDLSPINVEVIETAANLYGTRTFYRKASDRSDEEGDFSIEFEDSRWLEVYLWFKTFDIYSKKKYEGKITPPGGDYYAQNKILHDQITIYKFIVGEDGETIIHWAQLFGCFPLNVPREVFSDLSNDGHLKFTTHWKCTFQDDMMPNTISDFNALARRSNFTGVEVPIYDRTINAISGENVLVPYISLDGPGLSKYKQYKLKWGR